MLWSLVGLLVAADIVGFAGGLAGVNWVFQNTKETKGVFLFALCFITYVVLGTLAIAGTVLLSMNLVGS